MPPSDELPLSCGWWRFLLCCGYDPGYAINIISILSDTVLTKGSKFTNIFSLALRDVLFFVCYSCNDSQCYDGSARISKAAGSSGSSLCSVKTCSNLTVPLWSLRNAFPGFVVLVTTLARPVVLLPATWHDATVMVFKFHIQLPCIQ